MQLTIGKILSLWVATAYAALAYKWGGINGLKWSAGLLLPLAFIWFPEEIGNLTGYFDSGYVNVKTPGVIVSVIGWFFLVGLPVILFLIMRSRGM